jgi:hypothetical protein
MPFVGSAAFGLHDEQSLCYAAIVYVFVTLGLFGWRCVAYSRQQKYRPHWQLQAQRFLTLVGMHALPIPLFAILSSPLNCKFKDVWGSSSLPCFGSAHLSELLNDSCDRSFFERTYPTTPSLHPLQPFSAFPSSAWPASCSIFFSLL